MGRQPERHRPFRIAKGPWSRSFYGPDEKLRVFQRTGVDGTGMRTTFVEHRYDPLGRRVLSRTQRDSTCSAGVPACLSTIDRFVWDGDQLLAEHRISAPYMTHGADLEREADWGTPNTVAYAHMDK